MTATVRWGQCLFESAPDFIVKVTGSMSTSTHQPIEEPPHLWLRRRSSPARCLGPRRPVVALLERLKCSWKRTRATIAHRSVPDTMSRAELGLEFSHHWPRTTPASQDWLTRAMSSSRMSGGAIPRGGMLVTIPKPISAQQASCAKIGFEHDLASSAKANRGLPTDLRTRPSRRRHRVRQPQSPKVLGSMRT